MITSRDNATLKLVRKLLGQRKHRDERGLFAVEGEDLWTRRGSPASVLVHLLVAGESVEAALAGVSTLPHPARAIGVYRRSDLSAGGARHLSRALAARRPGERGHARPHRGCVRRRHRPLRWLRRPPPPALRVGGAIFLAPLVADAVPGRRVALAAHGGAPLGEADLTSPLTFLLGAEREGPALTSSHRAFTITIPLPGEAELLNVGGCRGDRALRARRSAAGARR